MNKLLTKIKTYDYKGFFLAHGEKVGMGVAGLVTLLCLALTSWGGYAKTPADMEVEAKKVQDQLQANRWPGDEREKYTVATANNEVARYLGPLELAQYDYQIPLSPKLYQYQLPADEVEVLAPVELIARPIEFTVVEQVLADAGEEPETRPAAGSKSDKSSDKKSKDKNKVKSGNLDQITAAAEEGGLGLGMQQSGVAYKSRGKRANVIVAVVDRRQQLEKLRKSLHVETLARADAALTYADFRIQRKRAIPGPDPWAGPWKDVVVDTAVDALKDVELEEADLIAAEFIEGVFTAGLPRRPDADWDPRVVVHPRIPTLDAQARNEEEAKNAAAAELLAGEDEEGGRKRRGLLRGQRDAKRMRREALNRAGEGFAGAVSDYMGGAGGAAGAMGAAGMGGAGMGMGMGMGMGGGGAPMGSRPPGGIPGGGGGQGVPARPDMSKVMSGAMGRGGAGGGMAAGGMAAGAMGGAGMAGAMGGAMMSGMGGMSGMSGMSGMGASGGAAYNGADLLMFRYFDFDVEPNECYIYRIQLVIDNPSYKSDFVRQPSVAEGDSRESEWSQPSTPSIAPKEIEYAVHRVPNPPSPQRVAELDVVQFDTDVGALVEATLPLKYGQYIGGEKEVEFPNLGSQVFKKDKVNFASQDLFLDAAPAPKLAPSLLADLGIDQRQLNSLQAQFDQAVTVNRFGELLPMEGGSTEEIAEARNRLKEQNDKFKDLKAKDSASTDSVDPFAGLLGNADDGKDSKKKRGRNSLKGGMGGMMGGGGMMGPGMMGGGGGSGMPMSGPGGMMGGAGAGNKKGKK